MMINIVYIPELYFRQLLSVMDQITFPNNDNSDAQAYARIRKAIGLCGAAIPFLCLSLLLTCKCWGKVLPSISHYYYTIVGDAFVGILFALGLFLILYKSVFKKRNLRRQENILTNASGVLALIVAFIPTNPENGDCYHLQLTNSYSEIFGGLGSLHLPSAGIMLLVFGIIAWRYFPLNPETGIADSPNKNIYRACAKFIFGALAILVVYFTDKVYLDGRYLSWLEKIRIVFLMECVAVFFFFVSWLKKGKMATVVKEVVHKVKNRLTSKKTPS